MNSSSSAINRHSRALRILRCLQSGPHFNAGELAIRMRVSRRTIYRDLELMRAAGINIVFDEEHDAYRVISKREIAPTRLGPEDLTRLLITSQLSPLSALSADFEMSVRESMSMLLGCYPESVRLPIQRIINSCRVRRTTDDKLRTDLLQRIMVAIGRGVHVDLTVVDSHSRKQRRAASVQRNDEAPPAAATHAPPLPTQAPPSEAPSGAEETGSHEPIAQFRFAPHMIEMDGSRWQVLGRSTTEMTRQAIDLVDVRHVELTTLPYTPPKNNRLRESQPLHSGLDLGSTSTENEPIASVH